MLITKLTPCNRVEIWQPRWKDRTVMAAKYKVGTHNEIVFTKAPTMKGSYYISGKAITKYPLQTNGKLLCYCVPLDDLELLERV